MGWYASLTVVGHRRLVSLSTRTPNVILQGMREATSVSAAPLSRREPSIFVPYLEWSRTSTRGLTPGSGTASGGRALTTRSACRRDIVASSGIVTVQSLRPTVYVRGKGRGFQVVRARGDLGTPVQNGGAKTEGDLEAETAPGVGARESLTSRESDATS